MEATGSISRGKTAEKHNTRECYRDEEHTPENIDRSRSADNIVLVNRPIEDVYRERFGAATEEYNARQVEKGHAERQIPDYLEKVRADKKLNPMYEFVVQVGNMDAHPEPDTAAGIYRDWLDGFEERFGKQFAVKQAIVHMDEATPHMHVELVPCAESRRGLSVQNSLNKAVKQAGFDDYKAMLAGWDEVLTECMEKHGITRIDGEKEKQMGGVDIDTYKRTMAVVNEAERRSMELNTEVADKQGDLVELESAIEDREAALKDASERLECLQQRIAEREMEPAQETVAESVRTLYKARNDGARSETLAGEVDGLRSRISELEGANQRARERVAELDRELPGLRGRYQQLEQRFRAVEIRVREVVAKLREVPETVSAWALDIARKLGKRTYDPNSLDYMARQATEAARGINASRGWEQHRNRGQSR